MIVHLCFGIITMFVATFLWRSQIAHGMFIVTLMVASVRATSQSLISFIRLFLLPPLCTVITWRMFFIINIYVILLVLKKKHNCCLLTCTRCMCGYVLKAWNGAGFYFQLFSREYEQRLEEKLAPLSPFKPSTPEQKVMEKDKKAPKPRGRSPPRRSSSRSRSNSRARAKKAS